MVIKDRIWPLIAVVLRKRELECETVPNKYIYRAGVGRRFYVS